MYKKSSINPAQLDKFFASGESIGVRKKKSTAINGMKIPPKINIALNTEFKQLAQPEGLSKTQTKSPKVFNFNIKKEITQEQIAQVQQTEYEAALDLACKDYPEIILDPSQRAAVLTLMQNPYACLVGNAGTGKSMVTKFFIAAIRKLSLYKRCAPKIVGCAFTGTAAAVLGTQIGPLTKHKIPCLTIHKLLRYGPESYYDDFGVRRMRFVPKYHEQNKLDVDIVIIDEGSMLQISLFNSLYEALERHVRIIIVGDIQQLKPTIGHSILAHAMKKWPVAGLEKIHRQAEDNSIIKNAYNVLSGKQPIHKEGQFNLIKLDKDPNKAAHKILLCIKRLRQSGAFDYKQDMIIVPNNAGVLGQLEINRVLRNMCNPTGKLERIAITRGAQYFAVGDKIMCIRNQTTSIVNGSTGIILDIVENPDYQGTAGFNSTATVSIDKLSMEQFSLDSFMAENSEPVDKYKHASAEEIEDEEQRACSHKILIHFDGHESPTWFSRMGEVASLRHGYARTCHKSQGSQARHVLVVLHRSVSQRATREWLYTAFTRAQKAVIFFGDESISQTIDRQSIPGISFEEKIRAFTIANTNSKIQPVLPKCVPYDKQTYNDIKYSRFRISQQVA